MVLEWIETIPWPIAVGIVWIFGLIFLMLSEIFNRLRKIEGHTPATSPKPTGRVHPKGPPIAPPSLPPPPGVRLYASGHMPETTPKPTGRPLADPSRQSP